MVGYAPLLIYFVWCVCLIFLVTLSHITHELSHYLLARYYRVPVGRILIGLPSKRVVRLKLLGIRFVVTMTFLCGGHTQIDYCNQPKDIVNRIRMIGPIHDTVFILVSMLALVLAPSLVIKGLFLVFVLVTVLGLVENYCYGTDFCLI